MKQIYLQCYFVSVRVHQRYKKGDDNLYESLSE